MQHADDSYGQQTHAWRSTLYNVITYVTSVNKEESKKEKQAKSNLIS